MENNDGHWAMDGEVWKWFHGDGGSTEKMKV